MKRKDIESRVAPLHEELLKHRNAFCPHGSLTLSRLLRPLHLAQILGVEYMESDSLSKHRFPYRGREKLNAAGLLDRQAGRVVVSTEFGPDCARFTGAHELGHWVLHEGEVMHRDPPNDGSRQSRKHPPIEREANYFASCFLMPASAVIKAFKLRFRKSIPMVFDNTVAYEVNSQRAHELSYVPDDPLDVEREKELAICRSFGGRQFHSLREEFCVSNTAMAIRLKELKLVRWP